MPGYSKSQNSLNPFYTKNCKGKRPFLNDNNQQDSSSCTCKINNHKRNKLPELITASCCSKVYFSCCKSLTEITQKVSLQLQRLSLAEHQELIKVKVITDIKLCQITNY